MTSNLPPEHAALNARSLLSLAKELASQDDAAARRTAADRAYYAAFLFSRDTLARLGRYTPAYSTDDHQGIRAALHEAIGNAANDEQRLRSARNQATYDTRDRHAVGPNSHRDVRPLSWMIEAAERIVTKVETLQI